MNFYSATDDLFQSLGVVDDVSITLMTPLAMASQNLQTTNAIGCACVVLISGYFESFLKDITQQLIAQLNGLGKPLASIPYAMRVKHFHSGAKALDWAIKQDKKLSNTASSEDLARRLGSVSDPAAYELAWEAFAQTNSNPGPDAVAGILSGLEISKSWREINALVTNHGQLDTFLQSFMEIRNMCAHTGTHSAPPTGFDLQDYTSKIRAIAECVDYLMRFQYETVYSHL